MQLPVNRLDDFPSAVVEGAEYLIPIPIAITSCRISRMHQPCPIMISSSNKKSFQLPMESSTFDAIGPISFQFVTGVSYLA